MIYLDNAATTKPFIEAARAAEKYNTDLYFNPSALYRNGLEIKEMLSGARKCILTQFSSDYDLVFTSGGTEADNTAIFSFAKRGNVVTTEGEHSAVYEAFKELKNRGVEVRFVPLEKNGGVNVDALLSSIDEKTSFVSVVHVNNETGAVNDIEKIAALAKAKNPSLIFHSDGVQAYCKLKYKLSGKVDLYSVSAHKINALKGTGALIKKRNLHLSPLLYGGGQENGLRSGTENVGGIAAFATSAAIHYKNHSENIEKFGKLKDIVLNNIDTSIFKIISDENCAPHIISLSAVGLKGEVLQHSLEDYDIIVGTGSACSSRHRHSRILGAAGYNSEVLDGAIRISFGVNNTEEEVYYAVDKLNTSAQKLKGIMKK